MRVPFSVGPCGGPSFRRLSLPTGGRRRDRQRTEKYRHGPHGGGSAHQRVEQPCSLTTAADAHTVDAEPHAVVTTVLPRGAPPHGIPPDQWMPHSRQPYEDHVRPYPRGCDAASLNAAWAEDRVVPVDGLEQADRDHVGERRRSPVGDEGQRQSAHPPDPPRLPQLRAGLHPEPPPPHDGP